MKSKLRKVYDLRSGFVHGGLAVEHPAGLILDAEFEEKERFDRLDLIDIGFNILMKTIQKMIVEDIDNLKFSEVLDRSRD